ncbi:hypothetical protein KHP62_06080 [Rhodobacteraceae bacterium NNCM2]|nr:hypothetical protein [Coraliihabitans acroporae]
MTGTGNAGAVNQGENGIGVTGGAESGRLAAGEALRFTFSHVVSLTSLVIHEAGREAERFELYDSANTLVATEVIDGAAASPLHVFSFAGLNLVGETFTLIGTSPSQYGRPNPNRGIRVQAMGGEPFTSVSAVPVPATLLLGASGLGIFGLIGGYRRRRSA